MNKDVLSVGFGKAGSQLHLPTWRRLGYTVTAYDKNPDKLDVAHFPDAASDEYASGNLRILPGLDTILSSPDIVDVVTASGNHTDGIEETLHSLQDFEAQPRAWLIEKPVVSSAEEASRLKQLIESGELFSEQLFVNENYNASVGVEQLHKIISEESAAGNDLTGIDVVFYKDRVPDVLNGRFTDPTLGAYGIELPHQLAIAYNLASVSPESEVRIADNIYYYSVHNVTHSEATYTRILTQMGVEIRLAQGLGPFRMHADGSMIPDDEPGIIRYTTAHFADGRNAKVLFDPVPGVERFHSVVEWQDSETGKEHKLIVRDNTVERVLGSVARYAETGEREKYSAGLSVEDAALYATTLIKLRDTASEQ